MEGKGECDAVLLGFESSGKTLLTKRLKSTTLPLTLNIDLKATLDPKTTPTVLMVQKKR